MKRLLFIMLIILATTPLLSQNLVAQDSLSSYSRNPWKAGLLSALVPGGGQFYNQAYIKGSAIIITEGLFLGYAIKNHNKSQDYYDKWKESGSENDFDQYEEYYEKRENDIWWLGITIFLSTLDAVTDAYLYDFEYEKQKVRLRFSDRSIQMEYKF